MKLPCVAGTILKFRGLRNLVMAIYYSLGRFIGRIVPGDTE